MTDDDDAAQRLYEEAMKHNWRQSASQSHAALARALFERAAVKQHRKALRELAEMMFAGSGGPKEPERGIALKWAAFKLGDGDALEELSALLGSYAEDVVRSNDRDRARLAAEKAENAHELLAWIESYIDDKTRFAHLSVGHA